MQNGWTRLGRAVEARRHELGLSQQGVGERGGPSHQTVRDIEHGEPRPKYGRTLANLERALGWRPGIAQQIVEGVAPDDSDEWLIRHEPASEASVVPATGDLDSAPSRLRDLLVGAGVGVKWRLRQLERYSRGRVTRAEWASMLEDNDIWSDEKLEEVTITLRRLGSTVSVQALKQAMVADHSHTSAIPRDELTELRERVDELDQKVQELSLQLEADRSHDQPY